MWFSCVCISFDVTAVVVWRWASPRLRSSSASRGVNATPDTLAPRQQPCAPWGIGIGIKELLQRGKVIRLCPRLKGSYGIEQLLIADASGFAVVGT